MLLVKQQRQSSGIVNLQYEEKSEIEVNIFQFILIEDVWNSGSRKKNDKQYKDRIIRFENQNFILDA